MKLVAAGTLAVLSLLAGTARAASFGVALTPWNEAGFFGAPGARGTGVITLNGTTLSYAFFVEGTTQPTVGYIQPGAAGTVGTPVVGFGFFDNPFLNGSVSGTLTTTQAVVDQIVADPTAFYVNLSNDENPAGALRGQLSPPGATTVFFPTVAKAHGLNGSNFVTDLSLLNHRAAAAVTLDFSASSESGQTAPTATRTVNVAAGEQLVLKDLLGQFGTSGDGALRVKAPREVTATARVFNDQTASGAGTTGLLVPASELSDLAASGVLPLLSQAAPGDVAAGIGYRTNIGYFNPNETPAAVTFEARRTSDGSLLGSATVTIPGLSRVQKGVFDLIGSVPEGDRVQPDFYLSFTASKGSALFAYAAVVDNKTADGIYVKATPRATSGTAPAAPPSLAGTWTGGGSGFDLTWRLTQHGDRIEGTKAVDVESGKFLGNATLSGTLSGTTLTLYGTALSGDSSRDCVDLITYRATVDGTTITGRYGEMGSCFPGDGGPISLTKN
jgi:hypothetical protein